MMLLRAFVSGQYLMHVMNSSAVLSKVRKLTTGSASPHLNVGEVRQFTIPFPPEKEQIEIVAEIERRISIVEEVEVQVDANMKRAARLRQSILKRAFEGRLVPQDPTDEPADKLLERIKAARDGKMNGEKPPRTRPSRRVSKMTDAEE